MLVSTMKTSNCMSEEAVFDAKYCSGSARKLGTQTEIKDRKGKNYDDDVNYFV